MTKPKRMVSLLSAGVLSLGLIACGGGEGSSSPTAATPVTPPTPPPPVTTVIAQGSFTGLGPRVLGRLPPFTTTATSTLEAVVDWTHATNDVDIYLVRGTCAFEQFVAGRCDVVAFSESVSAKPERIRVAAAPAGTFELLIGNLGPTEEACSYQIFQTTGGSAASSSRAGQATRLELYRGVIPVR